MKGILVRDISAGNFQVDLRPSLRNTHPQLVALLLGVYGSDGLRSVVRISVKRTLAGDHSGHALVVRSGETLKASSILRLSSRMERVHL